MGEAQKQNLDGSGSPLAFCETFRQEAFFGKQAEASGIQANSKWTYQWGPGAQGHGGIHATILLGCHGGLGGFDAPWCPP